MNPTSIRITNVPERPVGGTPAHYRQQEDALLARLIEAAETGRVELAVAASGGRIETTITAFGQNPTGWLSLLPDGYRAEPTDPPPVPTGAAAALVRRLAVVDHPDDDKPHARLAHAQARRTAGRVRRRAFTATAGNSEVLACAPTAWPLRKREEVDEPARWLQSLAELRDAAVVVSVGPVPDPDRAAAADVFGALRAVAEQPDEEQRPGAAARLLATTAAHLRTPTAGLRAVTVTAQRAARGRRPRAPPRVGRRTRGRRRAPGRSGRGAAVARGNRTATRRPVAGRSHGPQPRHPEHLGVRRVVPADPASGGAVHRGRSAAAADPARRPGPRPRVRRGLPVPAGGRRATGRGRAGPPLGLRRNAPHLPLFGTGGHPGQPAPPRGRAAHDPGGARSTGTGP